VPGDASMRHALGARDSGLVAGGAPPVRCGPIRFPSVPPRSSKVWLKWRRTQCRCTAMPTFALPGHQLVDPGRSQRRVPGSFSVTKLRQPISLGRNASSAQVDKARIELPRLRFSVGYPCGPRTYGFVLSRRPGRASACVFEDYAASASRKVRLAG